MSVGNMLFRRNSTVGSTTNFDLNHDDETWTRDYEPLNGSRRDSDSVEDTLEGSDQKEHVTAAPVNSALKPSDSDTHGAWYYIAWWGCYALMGIFILVLINRFRLEVKDATAFMDAVPGLILLIVLVVGIPLVLYFVLKGCTGLKEFDKGLGVDKAAPLINLALFLACYFVVCRFFFCGAISGIYKEKVPASVDGETKKVNVFAAVCNTFKHVSFGLTTITDSYHQHFNKTCGDGTKWDEVARQCVAGSAACGTGTTWDEVAKQCVAR
jgi:hypothetical protein